MSMYFSVRSALIHNFMCYYYICYNLIQQNLLKFYFIYKLCFILNLHSRFNYAFLLQCRSSMYDQSVILLLVNWKIFEVKIKLKKSQIIFNNWYIDK